jgi:cobalt-zinc-cadmium efflux system membrane fusion protein
MKLKSMVAIMLTAHIALSSVIYSPLALAESNHHSVEEEVEKGPNNGRMLHDGDFAIELAIFEGGVSPEFRVFATKGKTPLAGQNVAVKVQLTRLGDVVDEIDFYAGKNYLRGDKVIYEPHSFVVALTAKYAGKTYKWSYDNFEGRTVISDEMAKNVNIETEFVDSQTFNETLKVFGQLTLSPNAIRQISARFPGEIKKLHAVLGQKVKKGQLLLTIESNESLQTYPVFSPISGVVTHQVAGAGEQTGDRHLLTITDTGKLIAELGVFPMDQAKVKLGSPVKVSVAGSPKAIETRLFDTLFEVNAEQAKIFRAEIEC